MTDAIRCPRCDGELAGSPLHQCASCGGSWVAEADLHARAAHDPAREKLPWRVVSRATVHCPVCYAAMETLELFGIALDRCKPHGVWFDVDEMTELLVRTGRIPDPAPAAVEKAPASAPPPKRESQGGSVAWVVAETAGEVAVGLVGGVFEVLGELLSSIDV